MQSASFYNEDGITLYHGDCRDLLCLLDDLRSKIAIVSDPVYGMQADFTRRGLRRRTGLNGTADLTRTWKPVEGDDKPFDPSHLLDYPTVALFGANHYAHLLPPSSKWLVWDKRAGTHQDDNSDGELIWTNQKGALRIHYQKWRGIVREGEENLSRSRKLHPMQKPVSLMRWVIGQLKLRPGRIIVDPYMGSGSTLVAAKQLGYQAIGIEIDQEHCETAKVRLAQGALDLAV